MKELIINLTQLDWSNMKYIFEDRIDKIVIF